MMSATLNPISDDDAGYASPQPSSSSSPAPAAPGAPRKKNVGVTMKKKGEKCHSSSLHTIVGQFEDWFMINRLETSEYGDKMLRHVERALEKYGPCITQERDARGRLPTDRLLAIVADAEDADDDDDDERFINKVAINRSKRALDMIEGAAQDLL